MKNLILTMCLLLIVSLTYAQLHVIKSTKKSLNGAVGIGTSTPTAKLDVVGDAVIGSKGKETVTLDIGKGRTGSGSANINLRPFANQKLIGLFSSFRAISGIDEGKGVTTFSHKGDGSFTLRCFNENSSIRFLTSGEEGEQLTKLTITPNGNVGIGTTNPSYRLHVNGTAAKEGNDGWVILSDKRTKKNINTYNLGLSEVLKLNPVTFNYNGKAGIGDTEKEYVGLIAQEFAEIMPNAVSKYSHTDTVSNKTEEFMAINASSVRYMLVNGMKEQQALIEAQKAALEILKTEVAELKANGPSISTPGATEMSVLLEGSGTENALLAQNSPNPFTTNTRIEYFIPADSRHCRLSFRDMNGKELKQVNIEHDGIGAIELSAKDLAAGIYSYVLYVNGDIVASKKMILRQ